jgi:hypothetical protein
MDIKDGVTTSSKEQVRIHVRVWELDEITPKGGKDWSVTKEHSRGLKLKRLKFMQEEPSSWMWGRHRQNGANGGGKVHKDVRTHRSEGATEPGRDGPGPVGPSRPAWPTPGLVRLPLPLSWWVWRSFNPKDGEAPPFTEGESFAREVIHNLEREEEGDHSREGSLYSKEAPTGGGEGRHRRKRHHDQRCYA